MPRSVLDAEVAHPVEKRGVGRGFLDGRRRRRDQRAGHGIVGRGVGRLGAGRLRKVGWKGTPRKKTMK